MTDASAAETVGASTADDWLDIPRVSVADAAATRAYFESGPSHPVIYTDALDNWPALEKWSIGWFEREYGDKFGLIPKDFFDANSGKAVKLGDYIRNLDAAADDTPGFWVDDKMMPAATPPDGPDKTWAFGWRAFHDCPELMDDLGPYPAGSVNLVERLPDDVAQMLEWLTVTEFHSIYISRKGTITPLHYDFYHTIGSLAQIQGTKRVVLAEPREQDANELDGANPEDADYSANEHAAGRQHYHGKLSPGELLIIPPRWWHFVRSEDHTLTISHNFFSPENIGHFFRYVFRSMGATNSEDLQAKLNKSFPHEAAKPDQ